MENVKCLIIGSGPSGYTAAIYTSRANLSPVLYEGIEPGGQLTTTTEIENFPGFTEGIDGPKLMDNMRRQALRFGADIRPGVITSVDLSSRPFHVIVNGEKEIQAEALIISTGAAAKYLGLPSEEKFKGMGVSACATCDGFFYRKKDVAVVGGGDTACEEATYLASICRQVYLIVRKPYLRASKAMQERVMNTPNIKVLFEHNTAEVLGDETGVTGALLRDNKGTETKIDIAGFFVAIGHHPNTEIFADQLELDAEGYIKTVAGSSRTSVEGVFAAGDVQDPHYRQAITAAGSGCMAALDCERFLLLSIDMQEPVAPTERLVGDLKAAGYRLYVLSNMSREFIAFLRRFPVYRLFDGEVVSCEEGTVKPEPRIYEILLERYGLDPAETLFIDDRAANIAAAEGLGIAGYLFDHRNPAAACDELRRRLL